MQTLHLAVLLSGSGTTLQNLMDRSHAGDPYEVTVVIGSKPDAYGLTRAKNAGIPAVCVPRKEYENTDRYNTALWEEIRPYNVALIVLAGFAHMIRVPDDFRHKIVNIHPAFLPSFGGKGMYGAHVHEAVLEYGTKVTGCTVHFVDERYDTGPIILQKCVPVREDDTAETLEARVQETEREALPEALRLIAEGRVAVEGRRVRIA
jgi:phosphoribosylglycinamide formyltransferase-1